MFVIPENKSEGAGRGWKENPKPSAEFGSILLGVAALGSSYLLANRPRIQPGNLLDLLLPQPLPSAR